MEFNFGKESVVIGLSAVDLKGISGNGISWPASQTNRTKRHPKQCVHPRKRGKRAYIRAKLCKLGLKAVPLPSLHLASVCSQENKMNEKRLKLTLQWEIRDCCAHIFIETWLHPNILSQDGQTRLRADRTQDCGTRWGGGLACAWCLNAMC